MKTPSLFMFNIPQGKSMRRSVMFPVVIQGNLVTFATVSHAVEHVGGEYEMVIANASGEILPAQTTKTKVVVIPVETGADLAFVQVEIDSPPSAVRFSDRRIKKGEPLSHARNVMFRKEFKDQVFEVTTQNSAPLSGKRFTFENGDYFDTQEQKKFLGMVRANPLKGLSIRSWPGVSGSPLWDKFGNVLGMVCGGNVELSEKHPNFFLVYLPAKEIKRYLQVFIK